MERIGTAGAREGAARAMSGDGTFEMFSRVATDELMNAGRAGGAKVLVVEDEALVALDLQVRLEGLGYTVVGTADHRDEAVALFAEHLPDLVLMDLRLAQGDDGVAVARDLQAIAARPVVFITAHSDAQTLARAVATAPYGYLNKPFDDRVLAVTLAVTLERYAAEGRVRVFRDALEAAAAGVLLVSAGPRVEHANEAYLRLTGLTRAAVVGAAPKIPAAAPEGDAARALTEAIAHRQAHRAELPCVRAHGMPWTASVVVTPIPGDRGRAAETTFVWIADVTLERAAERALAQKQRLEVVGRLASSVAHDFNNVLTAIEVGIGLAREARDVAAAEVELAEAMRAMRTAQRLSRRLVESIGLARIETAGATDLADFLAGMRSTLERLTGSKIRLAVEATPGIVVAMNVDSLEQVLLNLVTNACDAMPGGGALRVSVDEVRGAGGASMARISVQDNGIGMDAETLEHVFEPFFTTKALGAGTGIGLTTTRTLVEQAGGRVQLRSQPGRGTVFEVELPLAPAGSVEVPAVTSQATEVAAHNTPARVLVVDDDEVVLRSLVRALVRRGLVVREARSFAEAIEALAAEEPDLLVTDVNLGDGNGLDLLRLTSAPTSPFSTLVISGALDAETARFRLAGTVATFLAKPFNVAAFSAAVAEALARSGGLPDAAPRA
jgi:PAS domain S-box-containing protein